MIKDNSLKKIVEFLWKIIKRYFFLLPNVDEVGNIVREKSKIYEKQKACSCKL